MRPIVRGTAPDHNGQQIVFLKYSNARKPLVARLGDYCSYCELPCNEGPAVEHVQPKSLRPHLELSWDNFLLGCCFCNSIKGSTPIVLDDFLWPDRDNTFQAFVYERDRAPQPDPKLSPAGRALAKSSLKLTGLDREPGHPELTPNDRRWSKRRDAWGRAWEARNRLDVQPAGSDEALRQQIVDTAAATGFWSVWMTEFAADQDMRRRLLDVQHFPGTCCNCFNSAKEPISRSGGRF